MPRTAHCATVRAVALRVGGRSALLEVHKYLEDVYLQPVEQEARPVAKGSAFTHCCCGVGSQGS
jgi:hypothetical protein